MAKIYYILCHEWDWGFILENTSEIKINLKLVLVISLIILCVSVFVNVYLSWTIFGVDGLTIRNDYLMEENDWLWEEIELAQFDFYYVLPIEQKFGVYALDDELRSGDWADPYEKSVFDCSEMSAYMEWELENLGWNTIIIAGDSPYGDGYHAWLLVEVDEGKYMPIETTTLEVVWWDNPYFDNFWEYDYEFETIFNALFYSETEFDWWED